MLSLEKNKDLILGYERIFAGVVATEVIEKPKPSIWMILIPIIFVFFFMRLNKVVKGRDEFADNFMISRKRALDEAYLVVKSGDPPDIDKLCNMSTVPQEIYPEYSGWLKLLVEHYGDLMRAQGESYEELIRATYLNRTNYLMSLNQLNAAEKRFDSALKPHIEEITPGVNEIVQSMEDCCARLRKSHAEYVFPS